MDVRDGKPKHRTWGYLPFIPIKFHLHPDYPDKEILKRSRQHDKLLNIILCLLLAFILTMLVGVFATESL
jgi:hypothetical protein